jgi:ribonuclease HI
VTAPTREPVVIYTDGSCKGNPGPAGAAALLTFRNREKMVSQYVGEGTNNVAELEAVRLALSMIKKRGFPIDIYTDSTYVIGVLTKNWKAKENKELIQKIKFVMSGFKDLRLLKVAGHAGIPQNELVDELAKNAVDTKQGISETREN